ncbi:PH domain-containing protein [Peribacillus tepidiphilus]|uniref:PH domain-containing protein n=1 Tax=Peribacillus tepidiphilus TaxID=2652445 RepID=UPI0035B563A5
MSEPKRLHPIAAVSNAMKTLKEAIIPFIALFVFGSNDSSKWQNIELIIILVSVVFILLYGWLSWLRFTYVLKDGEIIIEQGVFVRNKRYIRFERVQSIAVSEGVLQRLFGLVKVKIETAGSSGMLAEGVLTAISKEEADRISTSFSEIKNKNKNQAEIVTEHHEMEDVTLKTPTVFQMKFKELLLMAATSGGVGVVFSGAMAFLAQFEELIPYEKVFSRFEKFISSGVGVVAAAIFLGLVLAYVVATAGIVIKYAYFIVKKIEDELVITRGLLDRRKITIPLDKIQAIRIVENIIRQPLGYATVYIENAGGSVMDAEVSKVMLFPLIKKKELENLIPVFVPDYTANVSITSVPKRAFSRYLFRQWFVWLPVSVAVSAIFFPWGLTSLLLLPLSGIWAYLSYQSAGWNLTEDQLSLRYRIISKQTFIVKKRKIQSLDTKYSWFQNRKDLGTLSVFIKLGIGPGLGRVYDLEKSDIEQVKQWYLNG